MLRLRTRDGLDFDTLETRYGVDLPAQKADTLARLIDADYLTFETDRRIRLTPRGMLLCNTVTQELLPN
jgi:coproporphyrinogen III oxidase-like Fe-S oxidoreductase